MTETEKTQKSFLIPADIHIMARTVSISTIASRLENGEIDMEPEFQRKSGLWTQAQQSRLIESLMLKIPLPTFYFDASDENSWVVIDGLQRLSALNHFLVEKSLKLSGLEYLGEFEGCSLDELPRQYYRRIMESQIQIYTIEKGTPEEIVHNIFMRINTGGAPLNAQEIRHALYRGPAVRLVRRMAENKWFLKATGNSIKPIRLADCEYATRYLAFTELDYRTEYDGNMDRYLSKALKTVNCYSAEKIDCLELRFERIMKASYEILGEYAFRRISPENKRGPVNKAVFEAWCCCLFSCGEDEICALIRKKELVMERLIELFQTHSFGNALKAGDKYSVLKWIGLLSGMLEEILND